MPASALAALAALSRGYDSCRSETNKQSLHPTGQKHNILIHNDLRINLLYRPGQKRVLRKSPIQVVDWARDEGRTAPLWEPHTEVDFSVGGSPRTPLRGGEAGPEDPPVTSSRLLLSTALESDERTDPRRVALRCRRIGKARSGAQQQSPRELLDRRTSVGFDGRSLDRCKERSLMRPPAVNRLARPPRSPLLFALLIALSCSAPSPEHNVLLVSIDTLRPDYLGCYRLREIELRVPFILHIPGFSAARIDAPVELVDIMPTLFPTWESLLPIDSRVGICCPASGAKRRGRTCGCGSLSRGDTAPRCRMGSGSSSPAPAAAGGTVFSVRTI
jgi:hypothetical protein